MQSISKPTLKVVNYEKSVGNTRLELNITGTNIDYVVANTIRRTILSDVPIYAFTQFKFNKNTSIFNNNYMKLRIKNMPVLGIDNTIETHNPKPVTEEEYELPQAEQDDDVELDVDVFLRVEPKYLRNQLRVLRKGRWLSLDVFLSDHSKN
jgi:hypothetical protein